MQKWQVEWLKDVAALAFPYEACGFVLADGTVVEIKNVASNKATAFRMDERSALWVLKNREVSGVWHTHPSGRLTPSNTDVYAVEIGAVNPDWEYYIATSRAVMRWDITSGPPKRVKVLTSD